MKVVSTVAAVALVLGSAAEVLAVKQAHEVTKSSPELSIQAETKDDGTVEFMVIRDPKASRYHGTSYGRGAQLWVKGPKGTVTKCAVAETSEKGGIAYSFAVAADLLEHSHFVLSETDQTGLAGNEDKSLLGGGDLYYIRLKHFTPGPGAPGPRSK